MNAPRRNGFLPARRAPAARIAAASIAVLVGLATGARPAFAQGPRQPIPIAAVARQVPVDFEREVLPILRRNCTACHSASDAQSELNLESPASIRKGGDRGPAVVPKNAAVSLLLKVASHQTDPAMPPKGNTVKAVPLTPQELGLIRAWIDEGAGGTVTGALTPSRWIPLPRPVQAIQAVAVSADGQLAAAGRGNRIVVHHVPTGKLVADLVDPGLRPPAGTGPDPVFRPAAHLDLVQSLAFHPDGDLLASGAFREVKLWRRPRHVHRPIVSGAPLDVRLVAADPTGARLALAAADRAVHVLDRKSGAVAWKMAAHAGDVTALRFATDGTRLVSGSLDGTVRAWNAADGAPLSRLDVAHEVRALAVFGEGDARLATAGGDETIRVWSLPTGPAPLLADAAKETHRVAAGADRKRFALAAPSGDVQVFESATRSVVAAWKVPAAIEGIALNADGTRLATAAADGAVVLWDVAAKQSLDAFRGSRGPVTHVAFSPDGRQLASSGKDGLVAIWSLARPALREIVAVGTDPAAAAAAKRPIQRLVLSADGRRLATDDVVDGRAAIVVRDVETGRPVGPPLAGAAALGVCAFSADGTRLACGASDRTVRIWRLEDGKYVERLTIAAQAADVACLAFSPDGNRLVVGDVAKSVKVWNTADGTEISDLAGHAGAIVDVAFAGDNARIASASADKTVRFWTAADGKPQSSIAIPAAATALTLSRDSLRAAVACADGSIRTFQVADGKPLAAIDAGPGTIRFLSYSPDGARLVSAAVGGKEANLWDAATGRLLESFPEAAGVAAALASPTAGKLLVAAGDGRLQERATALVAVIGPGTPVDPQMPTPPTTGLLFRPDGQTVVRADAAGNLRGFAATTGLQVLTTVHGAPIRALATSPDGQLLATGGDDRLVKLWNTNGAANGNPLATEFKESVAAVAFSPDGTRIVVAGSAAGEAAVFDAASRKREQAFVEHAAGIAALATIGEGAGTIVSVAPREAVRIWSPGLLRRIPGHVQPVTALAIVPGTPPQIVSGSADGTVRRWNGETGQNVAVLNLGGPVRSVAVRADGQRIAAAGENKLGRLWNAATNQPTADLKGDFRAVALVGRLTQQAAAATARIALEKAALDVAEKDVPTKTTAATTTGTALAAADKEVAAKQEVAKKAVDAKTAAEKGAIEAAAAAQAAATAKDLADGTLAQARQAMQLAAAKSARAAALSTTNPQDPTFVKQKADSEKALADATAAATKAMQDAAAALASFNDATTKANAATTAAVATNKPSADAEAALRLAQAAQNRAAQADALARRERDEAVALIPVRKAALAAVEAELAALNKDLDAAKKRVVDAEQPETAVVFSSDGRFLALGGALRTVRTFDAETGVPIEAFDGHAAEIRSLAYAPDGTLLSAATGESAFAWDTNPAWVLERTIGRIDDPTVFLDRVLSVDFDRTGTLLATGGGIPSRSGEVKVWKTADGSPVRALADPHSDVVHAVAFSPDGQFLATASADKFVRRFRVADGALLRTYEGHTDYALGVAWRSNGRVLASAGADAVVNVWNVDTGDRLRQIAGYRRQVTSVRFVGETATVLSASGDRTVRFHNSDNGNAVLAFAGSTDYVYSAAASANGQAVVAGGYDGVLRIWNGTNGQILFAVAPPPPVDPAPAANGSGSR